MVTAKLFGLGFQNQYGAAPTDWLSDTIKAALCTSSFAPDQDTMQFFDDVTDEISGAGYTAGGEMLTGKAVNYDAPSNTFALDADDVPWTGTITARYLVLYKDTGTPSTSPLLGYVNFALDAVVDGGVLTMEWDAGGIINVIPD